MISRNIWKPTPTLPRIYALLPHQEEIQGVPFQNDNNKTRGHRSSFFIMSTVNDIQDGVVTFGGKIEDNRFDLVLGWPLPKPQKRSALVFRSKRK